MAWGAIATGAGALLGGAMGGSDDGSRKQTTRQKPPEWWSQPAQDTIGGMQEATGNQDFVGIMPVQYEGMQAGTDVARQMGEASQGLQPIQTLGGAEDLSQRTMRGDFLDPQTNPELQNHIQAAIRPAQEQFEEQMLPQIGSAAIDAGAFGGSAHGLAQAQAARAHDRNIQDTTSRMLSQAYGRERNAMQQAMQMAPSITQAGQRAQILPGQMLEEIGGRERAVEQEREQFPIQQQQQLAQLIAALNPGGGTTTQTTQGPGRLAGAMQGAIGGGSAAANIYDLLS